MAEWSECPACGRPPRTAAVDDVRRNAFSRVLWELGHVGHGLEYGISYRVCDSRYFGVPQRRRRVFILAAIAVGDPRAAAERAGEVLAVGSRCGGHSAAGGEAGADAAVASLSGLGNGGPDDNDGQAGRLVAGTVRSHMRPGSNDNGGIVAAPLTSGGHPNSNMPGRRKEDDENLVAMNLRGRDGGAMPEMDDVASLRAAEGGSSRSYAVTGFHMTQDPISSSELVPAIGSKSGGQGVGVGVGVRRLTPTECERLQALPDGWTDFGPDSRRYSALGDAVTATVSEWIGRRLIKAAA